MQAKTTSECSDTGKHDQVRIFDTTLRDGEQAPGFSMSSPQKLRVAEMLGELGVDVLEAGFPKVSPGDFDSVKAIAERVKGPTVCALARCVSGDIESASRALEKATSPRIHTFIATSDLHREFKLGMSRSEVIAAVTASVTQAGKYCDDVEFSAEDATRTDPDYLVEVFNAAIDAGATTLNVPDTVGYLTPNEIESLFEHLRTHLDNADDIVLSTHCHDDLGLAVANSMAAVRGGARQIECAINGIGERAGNAALEELAMILKVRGDAYGATCGLDTTKLMSVSQLLSQLVEQPVPRNKAIVGANAFAHESGIHQHGMIKNRQTYEIMQPEDVGLSGSQLVLGKHSGRAALRKRLEELGYTVDDQHLATLFESFKALADKQRIINDGHLRALMLGQGQDRIGPWQIVHLHTVSNLGGHASASISLAHVDGREANETATGDGPVEAVLRAFERAFEQPLNLMQFHIDAIGEGGDAQGRVTVEVDYDGQRWEGQGINVDIIGASAQAALEVVNAIASTKKDQTKENEA